MRQIQKKLLSLCRSFPRARPGVQFNNSQTGRLRRCRPTFVAEHGMPLQRIEWTHPQRRLMGCFQHHRRREPCLECLLPARGAHAPLLAHLQARKAKLRSRCTEIVTSRLCKLEKLFRQNRANRVQSGVIFVRIAAPSSEESGHGRAATAPQRSSDYIPRAPMAVRRDLRMKSGHRLLRCAASSSSINSYRS